MNPFIRLVRITRRKPQATRQPPLTRQAQPPASVPISRVYRLTKPWWRSIFATTHDHL